MDDRAAGSAGTVLIVGAGVAGLAAAHHLRQRGIAVTVLEASTRPGGAIHTVVQDGFTVDLGPNTLVARTDTLPNLIESLGLTQSVVRAQGAAQRFVVRGRQPVPLPTGPGSFLKTPLLSTRAKLRLLREPFISRRRQPDEESIADFVRRRLGREVLDYAVDPFVAGVFAGDPERLMVAHAFPMLPELEREHGSLLRGGIARIRSARKAGGRPSDRRPFSFTGGIQTLTDALAAPLAEDLHLRCSARSLRRSGQRYTITCDHDGASREYEADAVLLAVPPHRLADLDLGSSAPLATLRDVPMPPVAVMSLGFRREDVAHPLDGFGMLVPRREPFNILGALFTSSLFPNRAPAGHVLLTCFLGGSRRPADALLAEHEQVELVRRDLRELLGASGEPVTIVRYLWEHAIPQYEAGYGAALAAIRALEEEQPRLAVAGNVRQGISVGDSAASGIDAADRLGAALGAS